MIRLKYLARFQKGRIPPELFKESAVSRDPYLTMEYLRHQTTSPEFAEINGAIIAENGDSILLWDGSNAGEFIKARRGIVSSTTALVSVANVNAEYFFFLCKSLEPQIRAATVGMGIPHVNGEFVGNLTVELPPSDTQRKVTAFLNQQTARIDALINEKGRFLSFLAEKRRVLITRAVTHGMHNNAPRRDSDVPQIEQIPAHWSVLPLRRLITSLEQGWSPVASNLPADVDEYGVLKLSAIKGGRFISKENKALASDSGIPAELLIRKDDVFITRANTPKLVGDVAVAEGDHPNLIFSDLIYRVRADSAKVYPNWLVLALRSDVGRNQIEAEAKGSSATMVKLAQDQVLSLLIPVPPKDEQLAIAIYVQGETKKIDDFAKATERTITLLQERRSALISAAVTGQLMLGA